MRRTQGVLAASALVLAGCAAFVLISSGAPAPAKELGPALQTLHREAVPIAGTEVRIVPVSEAGSGSLGATRTIVGTAIAAPAPAISAIVEQPQRAVGQATCPANPHSGVPCVSR